LEKPFGFVVINKPVGLTSHDCVNRLRKVFGIKKIGHGGTLDPYVTGVLPIAIGSATRLISYLKGSKAYTGTIQLGAVTNTDDMQGEILLSKRWPIITKHNLNHLLDTFRGEILQKPPLFSSVHVKGERAYKKARRGESFNLTPKKVTINKLKLLNWCQQKGELAIEVDCSKGTYIRSLARDIGDKIGCGAYLKKLHRTKAFSFNENHSVLLPERLESYPEYLKPEILKPNNFLSHLYSFKLNSEEELLSWQSGRNINFGNSLERLKLPKKTEYNDDNTEQKNILIFDNKNDIAGIAILDEGLIIKPKIVFNAIG
tara:strand:+ start:68 stop:1012 length:945 start_codon:yes stop_codon:yes gene_type:complete